MVPMNKSLMIIFIIIACLVLSACGPSQEELDARTTQIAVEIFETQTAAAPSPTTSPTPKPPGSIVSFLVIGVDDIPISGASITLDGLESENSIKVTNDKG